MVTQERLILWTPSDGPAGLIIVPRMRPLIAVVGGRIVQAMAPPEAPDGLAGRRLRQVTLGGLIVVSNSRQKDPTRVIGHPDLASGASVQRGETLYVSVAEAIYRESRGEDVEIHLTPTADDAEALSDLRSRARHRWDNDRLPDGWTRPLPPPVISPSKEKEIQSDLPDELQELADRIRAKEREEGRD